MRRTKKVGKTWGIVFLFSVLCLLGFTRGSEEAKAEVLNFDFTFTSDETVKVSSLGDTILYEGWVKNTGSDPDSYAILMTVNPPTPPEWEVHLCSGGGCHPEGIIADTIYVTAGDSDFVGMEIMSFDTCGDANVTITVTSRGNPGLSNSITFLLGVHSGCTIPLTDRWGLLILISLLFLTGAYLILRRLRLATSG
jgi:hypothetical protein